MPPELENQATEQQPTHTPQPENSASTEFENLFRHNPFKSADSEGAAPGTSPQASPRPSNGTEVNGTPAAAPTNSQPTAAQVAPQQTATPQAAPQSQPTPDVAALRDVVSQLTSTVASQQRQPQPAPANAAEQPDPALDYAFEWPQQLQQLAMSENPQDRLRAVQIANAAYVTEAHRRIRSEMNGFVQKELPRIIQTALQAHTFRQTIQQDFFGKYPMLRDEGLAPLVQSMTQKVLNLQPAGSNIRWSDAIRDAIANEIFILIPHLRPQASNGQPVVQQPPVVQPPRIFTNGSRPAPTNSKEDEISNVLFGSH